MLRRIPASILKSVKSADARHRFHLARATGQFVAVAALLFGSSLTVHAAPTATALSTLTSTTLTGKGQFTSTATLTDVGTLTINGTPILIGAGNDIIAKINASAAGVDAVITTDGRLQLTSKILGVSPAITVSGLQAALAPVPTPPMITGVSPLPSAPGAGTLVIERGLDGMTADDLAACVIPVDIAAFAAPDDIVDDINGDENANGVPTACGKLTASLNSDTLEVTTKLTGSTSFLKIAYGAGPLAADDLFITGGPLAGPRTVHGTDGISTGSLLMDLGLRTTTAAVFTGAGDAATKSQYTIDLGTFADGTQAVAGKVTNATTKAPIVDALVAIGAVSKKTDALGAYRLLVPLGRQTLVVTADSYIDWSQPVQVTLSAGAARNVALTVATGTITGKVTDATTKAPIAGARVTAGVGSATTSGLGVYTLLAPIGSQTVNVSATGYSAWTPRTVTVTRNTRLTQDAALTHAHYAITGTVTDKTTSVPIVGAMVTVVGSVSTTTAAGGVYTLQAPAGSQTVTFTAFGYVDQSQTKMVTFGTPLTLNAALPLAKVPIDGKVTDASSEPVVGANVTVGSSSTTTRRKGLYTLDVPIGLQTVNVSAVGYDNSVPEAVTVTLGTPLTVKTVVLQQTVGTVTGTITDVSTQDALEGAEVTIGSVTTLTDSNGAYTLSPQIGHQTVRASLRGYMDLTSTVDVDIATPWNAPLIPAVGSISGEVIDATTRAPIDGAMVTVGTETETETTTSANDGSYSVPLVPLGRQVVRVTADGYVDWLQPVQVALSTNSTRNVALAPIVGIVAGRVTSDLTKAPIVGAQVVVGSVTATTNRLGAYTVVVPIGLQQTVDVTAAGYDPWTQDVDVARGARSTLNAAMTKEPAA